MNGMPPQFSFLQRQKRFLLLLVLSVPFLIGVFILEPPPLQGFAISNPRPFQYVLLAIVLLLFVLAKRQLKCPSCLKSVWPLNARNCPYCGMPLTGAPPIFERQVSIPSATHEEIPLDFSSFRQFDRYIRIMYIFWIPIALAGGALLIHTRDGWHFWGAAFTTVFIYGIGWFFSIYLPNEFLEACLWLKKGKCPKCGLRFSAEVVGALPGYIIFKRMIPQFCTGCGVKFKCVGLE